MHGTTGADAAGQALLAACGRLRGRYLGVDAGGSGTRVVLVQDGEVTARPDGPPMNALLTAGLAGHLSRIVAGTGAAAAAIGLPGLRSEARAAELSRLLSGPAGCPVLVTGDAACARAGAFCGQPGVVVIAGTGSAALGWDGTRSARAGGHGFLLGDEGSAYWIGRAAIRAALQAQDHAGGSELIRRAVVRAAGASLDELVGEISSHPAERDRVTRLAPVLTALAAADPEAMRIVRRAAEHLAALAGTVRRRLAPPPGAPLPGPAPEAATGTAPSAWPESAATGAFPGALPVAGAGGVFRDPVLWDRFAELTGATRPLASAAVGAALLAATQVPR